VPIDGADLLRAGAASSLHRVDARAVDTKVESDFSARNDMDTLFGTTPNERAEIQARSRTVCDFRESGSNHLSGVAELSSRRAISQDYVRPNWAPAVLQERLPRFRI
jgi:hypothetical protein